MSENKEKPRTVGFIGLGRMGQNMALRLLDCDIELVVHDANQSAVEPCVAAGARSATDPASVARECDVILSSLPGPHQVEQVCFSEKGLLAELRSGALYIDLSTNSPTLIQRIDDAFRAKGGRAIDAPVSGGPENCRNGTLTIFVGADQPEADRAEPLLQHLAADLLHIGPVGTGNVVKIVNNAVGLSTVSLLAEALSLGVKAGCDHRALHEALQKGAYGKGLYFNHLVPNLAFRHKYDPPQFALWIGRKDLGLAIDLGRELQVPLPLISAVEQEAIEMMARGHADKDATIIFSLQELRSNTVVHDADADPVEI